MTAQKDVPAKRKFRLFSSIGAKITLILMAMGAASAVGGILVTLVFAQTGRQMEVLTGEKVPQLELSSRLVNAAGRTKNAMIGVMQAGTEADLGAAEGEAGAAIVNLDDTVSGMPAAEQALFAPAAATASERLSSLVAARKGAFRNQTWIDTQTANLQTLSQAVQGKLVQANDAYRAAITAFVSADDRPSAGRILMHIAWIQSQAEQYDQSLLIYEQAEKLFRELGDDASRADVLMSSGGDLIRSGRGAEAIKRLRLAAAINGELSRGPQYAVSLYYLAGAYLGAGREHDACKTWQAALEVTRRTGQGSLGQGIIKNMRRCGG